MFFDFLSILIEEGCSNQMIKMCLKNRGFSDKEAGKIICSAGWGKEREWLKKWAKEDWKEKRFQEMRK